MDATYKETAIIQIEHNTSIDYELKADLIKVIKSLDEETIKNLTKDEKNRFFYKSSRADVGKALKDNLPKGKRTYMQATANRLAREGKVSNNTFIRDNFATTYTRGGHKYINGVRDY